MTWRRRLGPLSLRSPLVTVVWPWTAPRRTETPDSVLSLLRCLLDQVVRLSRTSLGQPRVEVIEHGQHTVDATLRPDRFGTTRLPRASDQRERLDRRRSLRLITAGRPGQKVWFGGQGCLLIATLFLFHGSGFTTL